jgi:type IV pilus assembly protein PilY1
MAGKSGWYLDLLGGGSVQQGERMIAPNQFQGNLLIGVTRIAQASDICSPTGSGWVMALNAFTGAGPLSNFFDVNRDGFVNDADSVGGGAAAGVGFGASPNDSIFVGSTMDTSFDDGTVVTIHTSTTTGAAQRVNWRELVTR